MRSRRITYETFESEYYKLLTQPDKGELIRSYGHKVEYTIITDNFSLSDASTGFSFKNCIFLGKFTFYNFRPNTDTFFSHCYFAKGISFININTQKKINILSSRIKNDFIVTDGSINTLFINAHSDNIIIGETNFKKLQIGGVEVKRIKNLSFLNTELVNELIQVNNCEIEKCSLHSTVIKSQAEFSNCKFNSFSFNNFRNQGSLKFLNCNSKSICNKKSHFSITNSNLGKTEFFQINFASFNELNIINSIVLDCIFINTKWAKNITSFYGDQENLYLNDRKPPKSFFSRFFNLNAETLDQIENRKDTYKQIKYALSKQGDYVNEQLFHSWEMNAYNKTLDLFSNNFWTKIILSLSRISSNYGISLIRPILFILILNLCIYLVILKIHNINIEFSSISDFTTFLKFLNPLHKTDFELHGWAFLFDSLSRLISSYSIYNIIRATRRFIR